MHSEEIEIDLLGQHLVLSKKKAVYWKETQNLLIADIHLGKAGHFRKAGIPVPSRIHRHDLARMDELLEKYQPRKLLLLGDLFHSEKNKEWDDFISWRQNCPELAIQLIIGNHDIISPSYYADLNILVSESLEAGPFTFTHCPADYSNSYNIAGHIHPGIHIAGKPGQSLKLPCFYFGKKGAVLPAFGNFTGSIALSPLPGDKIFAITPRAVMSIQ